MHRCEQLLSLLIGGLLAFAIVLGLVVGYLVFRRKPTPPPTPPSPPPAPPSPPAPPTPPAPPSDAVVQLDTGEEIKVG